MKIVVLQRPGRHTSRDFKVNLENALSDLKGELSASAKLDGFSKKGWARVEVAGEDHEVLLELIARQLGRAQPNASETELHGVYEGIVTGVINQNLEVDIGLETPRALGVTIQLSTLRAQLTDGQPLRSEEILENYCLFPGNRTSIRITRFDPVSGIVEGWLADSQVEKFSDWITIRLDRVQAIDCYRHEVEDAIQRTHLKRDVISIEPITLTAQSVICKIGTDAIGLIPKLGSLLKGRELKPFIPRRILARCRRW